VSKCFVQKTLFAALAATALVTAIPAAAESAFQSGTGALSASARVDFTIVIPRVLYLRVGTGSAYPGTLGTVGTVDLVSFSPAAGVLGNSTPVAGTGGDQGAGVVTAAVIGNVGQVTLTATSIGAMNDGGTNTIAYTEIATAASAQTSAYTLLAASRYRQTGPPRWLPPMPSGPIATRTPPCRRLAPTVVSTSITAASPIRRLPSRVRWRSVRCADGLPDRTDQRALAGR
jgi:hypothetical protein